MLDLVLGGVRSGKTNFAQQLAIKHGQPVVYVGTAASTDEEMAARIARHQRERPSGWRTVECSDQLDPPLFHASERETVLIDGLGVWVASVMRTLVALTVKGGALKGTLAPAAADAIEAPIQEALGVLLDWSAGRRGLTIIVSEEVGSGLVPEYPLGRLFRDLLGRANQAVAARAEHTYLVVAGIGVDLRLLVKALDEGPPPA